MKNLRETANSTLACGFAAMPTMYKFFAATKGKAKRTLGRWLRWMASVLVISFLFSLHAEDIHLQENGSAALLARSAFAHGYRHGYEQGFHQGNVDANMARRPKTRAFQFKGMPSGYQSDFGPKKSFEQGFAEGIKAGYGDGYAGHKFRAVGQLRQAGATLDAKAPLQDAANLHFDNGVALGYHDGFDHGSSAGAGPQLDLRSVSCAQPPSTGLQDKAVEESYCDGYRRGYLLGYGDGLASQVQRKLLEASQ